MKLIIALMSNMSGISRLIRLPNCILAAIATFVGGYLQTLEPDKSNLFLATIVTGLFCAAGNALNDRLDVEVDRINHPNRPLPRRELSLTEASLVALWCAATGLFIALFVSQSFLLLVGACGALLAWYNFRLKALPIIGNAIVALLGALTVMAGATAAGGDIWWWPGALFPAILAFILHFAREMTKDIADIDGDKVAGFATFPIKRGAEAALNVTTAAIAMLVVASLAPLYFHWYDELYGYTVITTVDIPLLVVLILLRRERLPRTVRAANLIFKFGMVMGLIAIYLGAFGRQ